MDSRTAAHVLSQIGALLEIKGEHRFKARAYVTAARALISLDADDLGVPLRSGALAATSGIGPATLAVIRDLVETGESSYLTRLLEGVPEGLLGLLKVPGLTPQRLQLIHDELGIDSAEELKEAARDGRLAKLPRFGPKTAEKILKGMEFLERNSHLLRYPAAAIDAQVLLASIGKHPDVVRAEIAGSLRRHTEIIADVDIVVECKSSPAGVADSVMRSPGVKTAVAGDDARSAKVEFVDGTRLDIFCASKSEYPVALVRATGNAAHVEALEKRAEELGMKLEGDRLLGPNGKALRLAGENALYRALGLVPVPPELREGRGEIEAAAVDELPNLVTVADIQGVLHCHTEYSDGTASIADMAGAARARGWSYIGITDHSEAAFYAGGLKREDLLRQHEEIDRLNSQFRGFRILKGIEADILADGQLDYDADVLSSLDYVVGSVHSRFSMEESEMTRRVLAAMDDPHLTILGHPTGRLLLSREPYAIDIDAVIEKAGATGVAIELNADPHRLDLDWRHCKRARDLGVTIEIGPDAHSEASLDNVYFGVGMARKGWLEAGDILNARSAGEAIAFAAKRRGQ